jgi:diketogulonate reductase-like aldo/keto reductase
MALVDDVILSNGVAHPRIGLGTFRMRGDVVEKSVRTAISVGIRHIDTATIYKVCV